MPFDYCALHMVGIVLVPASLADGQLTHRRTMFDSTCLICSSIHVMSSSTFFALSAHQAQIWSFRCAGNILDRRLVAVWSIGSAGMP